MKAGRVAAVVLVALAATAPRAVPGDGPVVRAWQTSGPPESAVDFVFVGDGYQKKHLAPDGKYWADVKRYASRLVAEPPFSWYRSKLNVRAVYLESKDVGCDDAKDAPAKKRTALGSSFDSLSGRLLGFRDDAALAAALAAAGPVDVALVMVNTERYGGSGTVLSRVKVRGRPLPVPTFSAFDTSSFLIALHELGHSFSTLADEYRDAEAVRTFPLPDDGTDLPHANVSLASAFDRTSRATIAKTVKWRHFLDLPGAVAHDWAHEGGYFRSTGVWRPWPRCRMREAADPFCPVCCEEMSRAIVEACGETFDDAAWHRAHPLSLWR